MEKLHQDVSIIRRRYFRFYIDSLIETRVSCITENNRGHYVLEEIMNANWVM